MTEERDDVYQFNFPHMEVTVQQSKTHYGVFWKRTKIGVLCKSGDVWTAETAQGLNDVSFSKKKSAAWAVCMLYVAELVQ